MNYHQQQIVDYIRRNVVVNSEQLCREFGYITDEDSVKRNLSRKSLDLYKEIEAINNDPCNNEIIIWDAKSNYWLARNKDEVEAFVERIYHQQAINKLVKMYRLIRKVRKHNQGDITTYDPETNAIEFVKIFVDDLVNDEEIERLIKENEDIENDERKYLNGRYKQIEINLKKIEELKKCNKKDVNGKLNPVSD